MAQTVATAISEEDDPDGVSADFQTAITQTLKHLSTTSENLQVIIYEKPNINLIFLKIICF